MQAAATLLDKVNFTANRCYISTIEAAGTGTIAGALHCALHSCCLLMSRYLSLYKSNVAAAECALQVHHIEHFDMLFYTSRVSAAESALQVHCIVLLNLLFYSLSVSAAESALHLLQVADQLARPVVTPDSLAAIGSGCLQRNFCRS